VIAIYILCFCWLIAGVLLGFVGGWHAAIRYVHRRLRD
jgi:hypothetical protein